MKITNVVHAIQGCGWMGAYLHLLFTSTLDGSSQFQNPAKGPPVTTGHWKRAHSSACTALALRSDNQDLQNLLVKLLSKQWRVWKENIKMGVKVRTDLNWLRIGSLAKLTMNRRVSCKAGNVWATRTNIGLLIMILFCKFVHINCDFQKAVNTDTLLRNCLLFTRVFLPVPGIKDFDQQPL
jgi:hypothetical protein